jgi:glycosyltransferase involved in cell wall biosynthesis
MRIVIDATPLLLRSAGVKNYIYQWLTALRAHTARDAIGTFPFFGRIGPLDHERSMTGGFSTVTALALLHGLNYSRLPWFAPNVDIFHAGQHLHNPPRQTRLTATIHDMTCWLMPELHSPANVAVTRWFGEHVMRRAAGLIAVSESARRDAIDILDLDPDRVTVIHHGVAEPFFQVSAGDVLSVRGRLGLAKPYALFVGTIEPRKNVPLLLDAWASLSPAIREEYDLVLAGPIGWAGRDTVARLRQPGAGIRYLGYVAEADLPALTAGAVLLAYPSLYEGFGLPVAQAMAAGVPVLTSAVSSLPEVAGEGALLVDPESVDEVSGGLKRLLGSAPLRERLGGAGRSKAREYRWETAARRSLEWFRKVREFR